MSLEIAERALERAMAAGAHSGDAVLVEDEATEVRVRDTEIEHVKQSRERSLGLRIFVAADGGLRQAITSTSDLAPDAVDRLAEDTVALARATAADSNAGLPDGGFAMDLPDLDLFDPAEGTIDVERHVADSRAAEAAARAVDDRIVNSEGSSSDSQRTRVAYANTAGFAGQYERAGHSLVSSPIAAENGEMQTDYWFAVARRRSALESPEAVGRRAAERALSQLGARRIPTCEVTVLFDPPTARGILGNLAASVSGYAVYRQSSFLAERLGERIASHAVTIVDDGRLPGGLGSKPFDGEGLPTGRKAVVENGILRSFLLDHYSARKLGLQSTGNASRSAGSAPGVAPTNLWIEPGSQSLDQLVQNMERGLLVTKLFGHGFNPVTGDFSRGAAGLWIENGEAVHPVEEITVAGNLADMLMDVDAVGSDLLWMGSVASPSLRISRMTVAGE